MTWSRHGWASLAGLVTFSVLTLLGGAWSPLAWYVLLGLAALTSILFWHYKRRAARRAEIRAVLPTAPVKDDRVIPQAVRMLVSARDNNECQLHGPRCTVVGETIDHKVPYEWGGSSKDPGNLWVACSACNTWKGDRWADTPAGRITRAEYMRAA